MIERGATATASITVTGGDLAGVLRQSPEDAFPPVYATSRLIGLMELAAARAMRPALRIGELSVGVSVDVRHSAATPIGMRVDPNTSMLTRSCAPWTVPSTIWAEQRAEVMQRKYMRAMAHHAVPSVGLPAHHERLVLAVVEGMGAGSTGVTLALLLMLAGPFRRGDARARWAVPAVGITFTLLTACAASTIDIRTLASPPWTRTLGLAALHVVGAAIPFVPRKRPAPRDQA